MVLISYLLLLWTLVSSAMGRGLLLLYRPKDISMDCAFSEHLRYDLSFGMGMSDTITLVLRTLSEIDYECGVEIVTEYDYSNVFLLVVIRFPTTISYNCQFNPHAFTVMKKADCLRLCDEIGDRNANSPYFTITVRGRIRFRFVSNSSINTDMNANLYEVTATSARLRGESPCDRSNETSCVMGEEYCFTSGVVCDGIKNCGIPDWFDERKSDCELPMERLSYSPVIALAAALVCASLAAIHLMSKFLPPLANSFFIFNINEDNRLCIVPIFRVIGTNRVEIEKMKKLSIIPVGSGSSSSSEEYQEHNYGGMTREIPSETFDEPKSILDEIEMAPKRKNTMRSMTAKIHERLRSVAGRAAVNTNSDATTPRKSSLRTFNTNQTK